MGILTSDPWEDAFIIIGFILAGLVVIALSYYLVAYTNLAVYTKPLFEYALVLLSLSPYVLLFSGFVIDTVNSNVMYSKASIIGLLTAVIVAVFGSENFANLSKNIIDMFPPLKSPSGVPGVPDDYNWWMIGVYLVIGVLITLPMMIGKLSGWAWGSSTAIGALFVLMLLAGNDFLGNTQTPFLGVTPKTIYSDDIQVTNACTTPGMDLLQTSFAPLGILINTAILSSHLSQSIDTNDTTTTIKVGVLTGILFLSEFATLTARDCLKEYKYGIWSPIISAIIGGGAGATAYFTMKQVGQESFTSSSSDGGVFHPSVTHTKTSQSKSDTKIVVGPQPDTSEPVDDQDAFVCEAYKDGELVTSTIVD